MIAESGPSIRAQSPWHLVSPPLDAEDRAVWRQSGEGLGVARDPVEASEKLDALRNQPRKLAQDRDASVDRELD